MKRLNVEYIDFDSHEKASETKNYPNSGFFIVRVGDIQSDLRMVDKIGKGVFFVTPESVFNSVIVDSNTYEDVEPIEVKKQYDGDFILEFSRILLNRK